jgi:hypothetical protein
MKGLLATSNELSLSLTKDRVCRTALDIHPVDHTLLMPGQRVVKPAVIDMPFSFTPDSKGRIMLQLDNVLLLPSKSLLFF